MRSLGRQLGLNDANIERQTLAKALSYACASIGAIISKECNTNSASAKLAARPDRTSGSEILLTKFMMRINTCEPRAVIRPRVWLAGDPTRRVPQFCPGAAPATRSSGE